MPSLSASYELFYQTPPTQTLPTDGWQLTLTLQLPIYDGGLRYGLIKERRALEGEARVRLDAELRLVNADVRTAHGRADARTYGAGRRRAKRRGSAPTSCG